MGFNILNPGGASSVVNPAGTDWRVGVHDFTSNEVFASGSTIYIGPFSAQYTGAGTGLSSFHRNSTTDETAFGQRQFLQPSSSGGYLSVQTDLESINLGTDTYRVGSRLMIEDIPDSGGEDYYIYVGFNSKGTNLNTINYAVLGINLSDDATNFVVKTKDGTTENVTDTGVAFAADTWYNLELELTSNACSAWIDGVKVLDGSTTNFPVSATAGMAASNLISSRLGTPAATRAVYSDFMYIAHKSAAARGALGSGGPF
jgi:hypothetical protein